MVLVQFCNMIGFMETELCSVCIIRLIFGEAKDMGSNTYVKSSRPDGWPRKFISQLLVPYQILLSRSQLLQWKSRLMLITGLLRLSVFNKAHSMTRQFAL